MAVWEVAVREPTCTGNNVTEVANYLSSLLPLPSPALNSVEYPFTAGRKGFLKNLAHKLCVNPGPSASALTAHYNASLTLKL